MGISIFQLFGRLSSFFTTFVNPIGLSSVGWKYLISYCCFLAFEIAFVYFFFPETFGRTLEELTFRKFSYFTNLMVTKFELMKTLVFEDKALADEAVHAVEKSLAHHEEKIVPESKVETKEV